MFRVMAAALSLTMGRLGALVGNLLFGYLIDLACVVPVVLFAVFLFGKWICIYCTFYIFIVQDFINLQGILFIEKDLIQV